MDLYEHNIDKKKFQFTNKVWNKLQLNSRWSIGYVSELIKTRHFNTKEEWKEFYYQSGAKRLLKAHELGIDPLTTLNRFTLRNIPYPEEYKFLNYTHGRTIEELHERAKYMFEHIEKIENPLSITLEECVSIVEYRVIGETWNGILGREKSTIETLQTIFPALTFKKCTVEEDYEFAVDYEVYSGSQLLCALQIKSPSYLNPFFSTLAVTKKINESKNEKYRSLKNTEVLYVFSTNKGCIENKEVIAKLQLLAESPSLSSSVAYKQQISGQTISPA